MKRKKSFLRIDLKFWIKRFDWERVCLLEMVAIVASKVSLISAHDRQRLEDGLGGHEAEASPQVGGVRGRQVETGLLLIAAFYDQTFNC